MKKLLHHYFIPHSHNNHRAKILHHSTIGLLVVVLFFLTVSFSFLKFKNPQVLGISYSIVQDELLQLTNQERAKKGLPPLKLSTELSRAASSKATHMFSNNYWAHFAPDGTSPWYFIKSAGYKYEYAGENLAKGYTSSRDVVEAWMKSSSHRENMLSKNYGEIGFAVQDGTLEGEDTVLVVELLGSRLGSSTLADAGSSVVPQENTLQISESAEETQGEVKAQQGGIRGSLQRKPLIDSVVVPKTLILSLFSLLITTLILDVMIVYKKKLPRIVGHNLDHIMLISLFILFIILTKQGIVQ